MRFAGFCKENFKIANKEKKSNVGNEGLIAGPDGSVITPNSATRSQRTILYLCFETIYT